MRAIHQHHDADVTTTETRALSEAPSPWLAVRVIRSVGAAVLLLVGSFLEWFDGTDGSALAIQGLWETDAGTAGFFSSAGLVTAICGAVIILGLAFKGGWLTRFAGAVALVVFTLVVIQLGRSGALDSIEDVGIGLWMVLAGGILALVGGFFPTTRVVAAATAVNDTTTTTTTTTTDRHPRRRRRGCPSDGKDRDPADSRPGHGHPGAIAVAVGVVVAAGGVDVRRFRESEHHESDARARTF